MTAPAHGDGYLKDAWRDYQQAAQQASNVYLTSTVNAYNKYLTGPYPDRASYEAAERQHWHHYYHYCRRAWRTYETAILTGPARPAPDTTGYAQQLRADLAAQHGPNCTECGIPWDQPSPYCPRRQHDVHPLPAGPPGYGPPAGYADQHAMPQPYPGPDPASKDDESWLSS